MANFFFIKGYDNRAKQEKHSLHAFASAHSISTRHNEWPTSGASIRTEVCPPALFAHSQTLWRRWVSTAWQWLWDENELDSHPFVLKQLEKVRNDFIDVLWDLQSYQSCQIYEQIKESRSMLDLWHLRTDIYQLIATHRGETQAQYRLDRLNQHFPIRVNKVANRIN